jgi:hypothetical protein
LSETAIAIRGAGSEVRKCRRQLAAATIRGNHPAMTAIAARRAWLAMAAAALPGRHAA